MSVKNFISKNFSSENYGVKTNLLTLFNQSRCTKSLGKLLILAVDQGFEHGPDRAFVKNDSAFDPIYHHQFAIDCKFSAYAAPLGQIESSIGECFGGVPLILKLNSGNSLSPTAPSQNLTATVDDALRLGCLGIGLTLYPGSSLNPINDFKEVAKEAKAKGLFVIAWSYPRGEHLSKEEETALDVVSYGAHMACLLGANIVKVKIPSNHLKWNYISKTINAKMDDVKDRIAHVVKCSFAGKRIVIFSGGDAKTESELINEVSAIKDANGFGSIIGRNIFQRPRDEAISLVKEIKKIYNLID